MSHKDKKVSRMLYLCTLNVLLKESLMKSFLPLVSVIIPVYNAESYVKTCIQSVVCQSYINLEVIVVNDGSSDQSRFIIEECARQDVRIKLINKPFNEGPSLARKSGIDLASGTYIQYLDSDDTLISDAIQQLVDKAEASQADIVAAPFFFCFPDNPDMPSVSLDFEELSGIEYLRRIIQRKAYWSVWSNFQRRTLFVENEIETAPDLIIGEDSFLMFQLTLYARKVVHVEKPILRYNYNPASITNSGKASERHFRSLRAYPVYIKNYVEKRGLTEKLEYEVAAVHMISAFDCFGWWRRFDYVCSDMKRVSRDLKRFPELKTLLDRHQLKLATAYGVSRFWGDFRLRKYYK